MAAPNFKSGHMRETIMARHKRKGRKSKR